MAQSGHESVEVGRVHRPRLDLEELPPYVLEL
jgi:hypothetical protein